MGFLQMRSAARVQGSQKKTTALIQDGSAEGEGNKKTRTTRASEADKTG